MTVILTTHAFPVHGEKWCFENSHLTLRYLAERAGRAPWAWARLPGLGTCTGVTVLACRARWHTSERSWITSHRGESEYYDRFRFGWTAYCMWRTTPWSWASLTGFASSHTDDQRFCGYRRGLDEPWITSSRRPEPAHGGKR